ncbi:MarR family winged helix-turn-helix transcriptional regulator [Pontivivens insulae]|nr:MarR family transcriptional regulator [Pontivivens insulae]
MNDQFDLNGFMPYMLNRAAEGTSKGFQRHYADRYGMLRTEWRVLFHLGRYGDLTAKEICHRASLHKTKVSRAVAALEARRFLTRTTLETDRRHEVLSLTRGGQSAFKDLIGEAQRYHTRLMEPFSTDERATIRKFLDMMASQPR